MKVGFIAGTLGQGGAERQLFYMLRALQRAGVEPKVLCLTQGETFERPIRDLGIEIDWVGRSKSRVVRMLTIISKLKKKPVDVLQSSHFYTNIYAAAAGRSLGIPCLGAIRNDLTSEIAANGILGKWQLRLPGHLIANSRLALNRAECLGIDPRRLYFLQNAVDVQCANGRAQKIEADGAHILFVGRLVPQKNPELFVRLAARLVRALPHQRLTFEVVGDGPLRTGLEQFVSKRGLSPSQFYFSGTSANTHAVYKRADIVVLTSDHEGTPNVVLEAMANGLPVVATKVGGVTEILDHERGYLVEPRDLEALVLACANLISDPGLRRRLGKSGSQYVAVNHSPTSLEKKLSSIYATLTTGGNRLNG